MTTYYVGPGGSDAAAGTSYGARWLTIGKALGAAGIASGDTVYVTPGTYRETITVAMTSATVETFVIGDVDGSHTSGVPGEITLSGYTTNDLTAPSASTLCDLDGRDHLTFRNIRFLGGDLSYTPRAVDLTAGAGRALHTTFTDCTFHGAVWGGEGFGVGVAADLLFDRCRFISLSECCELAGNPVAGADFDIGVEFRNCLFLPMGDVALFFDYVGVAAGLPGGLKWNNCTVIGNKGISVDGTSTSIPVVVSNSFFYCSVFALEAATSGQISEDYNIIHAVTPRTNVSAGAHSSSVAAPLFYFGQEYVVGQYARPFGTPTATSPLLGFGGAASPPAVDLLNRPRPAGGQIVGAAGALERHDSARRETSTTDAGDAIAFLGPGDHDFYIPVNAASTVITVRGRYDTNHGTGSKPQTILLANPEIGVTTETKTMTVGVDTWETLTFSAITPTAKGVVTVRVVSRAAATSGYAFFDTVTVT